MVYLIALAIFVLSILVGVYYMLEKEQNVEGILIIVFGCSCAYAIARAG